MLNISITLARMGLELKIIGPLSFLKPMMKLTSRYPVIVL